jgi:hypothetical protein
MTLIGPVLCLACTRLDRSTREVETCLAYPKGIPVEIRDGGDHRKLRGDETQRLVFEQASTPAADVVLEAWLATSTR